MALKDLNQLVMEIGNARASVMISKLIGGFKEGYEMNEFQGNPDHWNGRDDKNGYTEGKWLAQRKK